MAAPLALFRRKDWFRQLERNLSVIQRLFTTSNELLIKQIWTADGAGTRGQGPRGRRRTPGARREVPTATGQ